MRDFSSAGIDYYGVLEIEKHASDREIKESYRRLALKYHPVRNRDHFEKEPQRFQQLCEAYDVLSSSLYRTIYDQYGEAGLKRGVPRPEGGFYDPYVYCGEPEETFREFFGTNSPYADIIDNIKKPLSHYQGDDGTCQRKKAPDLVTPLVLSLQELYTGCLKKVRVSRRVLDDSGTNTTLCEKILTLHIEPGWPAGKTITFREEGDQGPNIIPGDLVFVLEDAAHAQFERDGHDLVYLMRVPLVHALTGCSVDVETLDGRLLHVGYHSKNMQMSVSEICDKGTVVHLLGHVIGLVHQHSRPDRDRFLHIQFHNTALEDVLFLNYKDYDKCPYDYRSVMHYDMYGLSYNGESVFLGRSEDKKVDGLVLSSAIGTDWTKPSDSDAALVNREYGCPLKSAATSSRNRQSAIRTFARIKCTSNGASPSRA
ncbi:dnaJ homolog subfamily B member 13-like [Pollicipes pollicipes]|uniref:dnaJ homolog subfamily B member 13-like n=1 Tax=Pollicipes pollicipes TaxID=41117 RepID=UPI00188495FA|nr:dnaJ homolog subfamily B member 13-like [Pollicipes pollicipes]